MIAFLPYKSGLRRVKVTRYMQPLREGGSLPALAEADDTFKYVLKFRGTGHGEKALVAEYVAGEIARALGLKVPELVLADLDEAFGRTEGDEEIQDLLKASQGLNLALHFLSGALTFDPAAHPVTAELASRIVWFDSFVTNIDRTVRNTNLLMWNRELWLIDHGSCLSFQHAWDDLDKAARNPFPYVKEHVLLPAAAKIAEASAACAATLTEPVLNRIVSGIPDEWLRWRDTAHSPGTLRSLYLRYFLTRLEHQEVFTKEAVHARETSV